MIYKLKYWCKNPLQLVVASECLLAVVRGTHYYVELIVSEKTKTYPPTSLQAEGVTCRELASWFWLQERRELSGVLLALLVGEMNGLGRKDPHEIQIKGVWVSNVTIQKYALGRRLTKNVVNGAQWLGYVNSFHVHACSRMIREQQTDQWRPCREEVGPNIYTRDVYHQKEAYLLWTIKGASRHLEKVHSCEAAGVRKT
ncbi:hypothetical protein EDD85DRAFT_790532 [Armillaria nabsnona]|nr:hypothetical protein EDD85DRAFT_790532 [Armillaria nabsnona]